MRLLQGSEKLAAMGIYYTGKSAEVRTELSSNQQSDLAGNAWMAPHTSAALFTKKTCLLSILNHATKCGRFPTSILHDTGAWLGPATAETFASLFDSDSE